MAPSSRTLWTVHAERSTGGRHGGGRRGLRAQHRKHRPGAHRFGDQRRTWRVWLLALSGIALASLFGIVSAAFATPIEPLAPGAGPQVFVGYSDGSRAKPATARFFDASVVRLVSDSATV